MTFDTGDVLQIMVIIVPITIFLLKIQADSKEAKRASKHIADSQVAQRLKQEKALTRVIEKVTAALKINNQKMVNLEKRIQSCKYCSKEL